MARLVAFLLFLIFIDEGACAYKTHLIAPLDWVHVVLLDPTPIRVRPFDVIMLVLGVIAWSKRDGKAPPVAPMKSALLLMLGTTILWFMLGMLRGGDSHNASWQTYMIFSTILMSFAFGAIFRTPEHFRELAKWLMVVALYRAVMCWISYFTWARDRVGETGAFLTNHEDTIAWVVSIFVLIVNAVEKKSLFITVRNAALILFIAGAIQFNSRRLAWVSLSLGLVALYFLFPKGDATRRRVNRAVRIVAPLVLIYVVVGWGRPSKIFLPLRSLSSVSTQEDSSTIARNVENLGLISTANFTSPLTGSGWGRPYSCLSTKYDISTFELWQYMPHNSILGLLAFTGILGFAGFWLAFPTAMFLNARVALLARDPRARAVGVIGASQLVVCANQLFADMGIFSHCVMYAIAVSYAAALRLPRVAGVWALPSPKARIGTT